MASDLAVCFPAPLIAGDLPFALRAAAFFVAGLAARVLAGLLAACFFAVIGFLEIGFLVVTFFFVDDFFVLADEAATTFLADLAAAAELDLPAELDRRAEAAAFFVATFLAAAFLAAAGFVELFLTEIRLPAAFFVSDLAAFLPPLVPAEARVDLADDARFLADADFAVVDGVAFLPVADFLGLKFKFPSNRGHRFGDGSQFLIFCQTEASYFRRNAKAS